MRRWMRVTLIAFAAILPIAAARAGSDAAAAPEAAIVRLRADLVFAAAPGLPEGATQALLRSDPATGGIERFVRFPAGLHIGAHWHSAGERVVVVQGSIMLRIGDATKELGAGSFAWIPPRTIHEAWVDTSGATVFQIFTATPDRRAPEELRATK